MMVIIFHLFLCSLLAEPINYYVWVWVATTALTWLRYVPFFSNYKEQNGPSPGVDGMVPEDSPSSVGPWLRMEQVISCITVRSEEYVGLEVEIVAMKGQGVHLQVCNRGLENLARGVL